MAKATTFDYNAAYDRMMKDTELVNKLKKRFANFKSALLDEDETVFQRITQKHGELYWEDYPEQMTRRVFLHASHIPAVWAFIQGRRMPEEKRKLKREAEKLNKISMRLPDPYAKQIKEVALDLEAEVAHELRNTLTYGLSRKPTLRTFAICRVYNDICEKLPCIECRLTYQSEETRILDYSQRAPNRETADIVDSLLFDKNTVTVDEVAHAMQ